MSKIIFPTASQTCSSWGPSKELELAKCKEDLQSLDVEKIFSASSRIAKVMSWEGGGWAPGLHSGAWTISGAWDFAHSGQAVFLFLWRLQSPWILVQLMPSVPKGPTI